MKSPRRYSQPRRSQKVACTVSAAALMLGVSSAATVGLHFQVHYCYDSRYTGFPVSMTAFGVAPSAWQSLKPMDTGYGCGTGPGPFTLSQMVDTTTSTNGLNPLPNGSLTITWSGDTANFSGFGGYGVNSPSHGYNGAPPVPIPTGEWQVYSGFIRDGVNFGPGSSGGNNTQPGYSIDLVGLKSVFTNTPFVVQLIAASDSMEYLTNAFIIDATANSTQSVIYPSTPPVVDVNDTAWVRGHGGGLSTGSASLNTDHLMIIGNRAGHEGPKSGYNFASTISGFIVTDKPVVTMSPQPALVSAGDTVQWSACALGVPPLRYQWRKNGAPIPGATNLAYSITNVSRADIGAYDLRVTNQYGSAISSPVTVGDVISTIPLSGVVADSNPRGFEHNGQNNGATWLASSTDGASVTRAGVMRFTAATPSQIVVAGETNFDTATGTIMFWMRSAGVANPGGNPAALLDRFKVSGCVIAQISDGTLVFQAEANSTLAAYGVTVGSVSDNKWHQITLVYDQSLSGPLGGAATFYVDGQSNSTTSAGLDWSWHSGQALEFGLSHDTNSWQAYQGLLDDIRFYNRPLSAAEVASAHSGALVDTNALVMRLNFDAVPGTGISLQWQCPDASLQSADSINGPFTDVAGAVTPYSISTQRTAKFFRYRGHQPVIVVSNPYLM
jgi:hypothetical protein